MRVDSREQRRADAVYVVLFEGDVVRGSRVSVFLGETEIDDVDEVRGSAGAHDKVGGFDVAVDVVFRVDKLDTGYLREGGSTGMVVTRRRGSRVDRRGAGQS